MAEQTAKYIKRVEDEGFIVTTVQDSIICDPSPARLAYDKIFNTFNPAGFAMFRRGFEAPRKVHVVMGNDFPDSVWSTEELADAAVQKHVTTDKLARRQIYWRVDSFNLDNKDS